MHPIITEGRSKRVVVVGDCMLDRYWQGKVTRISPEAPVPVMQMGEQFDRLGGAGNVALNVRKLCGSAGLLGVLGADDAASAFLNLLRSQGIDDHMLQCAEIPTTVKLRLISQNQQLLRVDFEQHLPISAAAQMTDAIAAVSESSGCVIFSDYNKGALAQVQEMIQYVKSKGIPAIVDPKGKDYGKYRGADVVTPNQGELAEIIGRWPDEDTLSERAFALRRELNLGSILLTRAEHGMSLFTEKNGRDMRADYPAETRDVFDVTGAGDTAIATLAVMISEGKPLDEAVRLANRAAGIVVGKFGTSSVTREELLDAMRAR
jgi:rfaE bifunctional protein kinase chain/domain